MTLPRFPSPRRLAAGLLALCCAGAGATELVYTPVNPTFGGNPLNAAALLNNANAQNDYKAKTSTTSSASTKQSALDRFTQQLETAVLNRLTSTAVSNLFDADGRILPNRTITAGNFVISITTDEKGNLVLTTSDNTIPGSQTQIVVGNVSDQ